MRTFIFFTFLILGSCASTSIEDVAEDVVSKGHGVSIDIEPGQKK